MTAPLRFVQRPHTVEIVALRKSGLQPVDIVKTLQAKHGSVITRGMVSGALYRAGLCSPDEKRTDTYSIQERDQIVEEATREGLYKTSRKHGLSASTISVWKKLREGQEVVKRCSPSIRRFSWEDEDKAIG